MKEVLIIGSGISGMSCAVSCAELGMRAYLVSPFPSERSQSVMAAGGINAVLSDCEEGDSVEKHIEDTLKGGAYIAGRESVRGLCEGASGIVDHLEKAGMIFSKSDGSVARRAFGGQTFKRTCYAGSSTGKQIVSALIMEVRRYEAKGLIKRMLWQDFHSGLIEGGRCYGALLYNEVTQSLEAVYADALVMATGGQNALFGKTTGSTQCDGYSAGRLFMQGAELKNLEFIQYHPTTMETHQKRMLISEAARGEGGRVFYEDDGRRIYFLEDKYGPKGNLVTRDIASREIYSVTEAGHKVYLDVSFLSSDHIDSRLPEVRDLCKKYIGIDISKEPIPIGPSVHFFMGGLAVKNNHETNIKDLYAVGECASIYHGANRLGGNSLLAALYSGRVAAKDIAEKGEAADTEERQRPDFGSYAEEENKKLQALMQNDSHFPVTYIHEVLAGIMKKDLGIVRNEESLAKGIEDIDYYLGIADKIKPDSSVLPYFNYGLKGMLTLAKAVLVSAKERRESRGSHYRSDYDAASDDFAYASIIGYDDGRFTVRYDREAEYEH